MVRAGTPATFLERAPAGSTTLSFEDPARMCAVLSAPRLDLAAVAMDVKLVEETGLVRTRRQRNPRHVEVKTRDLLRHLRRHGCDLKREGGVHALWPSSVMRPVGAVRRQPVVSSLLANTVRAGLSVPPVIE